MMKKLEITKEFEKDLEDAHSFSSNHKKQLLNDKRCGCFQCKRIFNPREIKCWVHDRYDDTALCPYCGVDSVIGESSGYPITEEFLNRMEKYWFQCGTLMWDEDDE